MKILIGVDETEKAVNAVTFCKSMAHRLRDDETHHAILYRSTYPNEPHVVHRGGPTVHDTAAYTRRELGQQLEDVDLKVEVVYDGNHPAEGLASLAAQEGVDLIVISDQRLHPSVGLYLGSVGQRLIQLAPCPVVVVQDECLSARSDTGPLTWVLGYDGSPAAGAGMAYLERLTDAFLRPTHSQHRVVLVHAMEKLPSFTPDDEYRLGGEAPLSCDGDRDTPRTTASKVKGTYRNLEGNAAPAFGIDGPLHGSCKRTSGFQSD